MQLLKLLPHLSASEIKKITYSQKNARCFQDWQVIFLVSKNPGKKAEEIGSRLDINVNKIYRLVQAYNKYGKDWLSTKQWGGRREATSNLSLEEESKMMKDLEKKAVKGLIITASDIRKHVETRIGKSVSDDYIWDLFKRQSWKKKSPRPEHPKSNKEKQVSFKKNLKKIWMPSS